MSDELRNLISGVTSELNPETTDNQEAPTAQTADEFLEEEPVEVETDTETTDEVLEEAVEEVEDESEDAEDEKAEEDSEDAGEKYTVKVDGKVLEVSLDELKNGYQRQADYTREKQALKAQVEEFAQEREAFVEQISALEELEGAWSENPVTVLSHFASNTQNPTQAVALLIQDLASANLLDSQFLQMFGITPDIQQEWAREKELTQLRSSNERGASAQEQKYLAAQQELAIQQAIAEYDAQIDDIIENEDLNFNTKQRAAFRQELAAYAAENDITNLKAAYKAFKYEESQKQKAFAQKTVAKAKAKKATTVVSRSGGGEGAPVQDNSDLNAVIRAAMKEANSN